jgi:hypothetical protein
LDATIDFVEAQYKTKVRFLRVDGETALDKSFRQRMLHRGIVVEVIAPDTPAQNGGSEKAGHYITMRARTMAIDANLPHDLWPEAYKTAIYLGNITPRESLRWKTPYEVITGKKPRLAHLHPFGCKAYALKNDIPKRQKLQLRALIGYFVGYDSTNIFRIWIPSRTKVIRTRDVQFDHNSFYDPYDIDVGHAMQERAEILVETLQAVDMQDGDLDDSALDTIIVDVPFAPIN